MNIVELEIDVLLEQSAYTYKKLADEVQLTVQSPKGIL
jgi:hypothetical protein